MKTQNGTFTAVGRTVSVLAGSVALMMVLGVKARADYGLKPSPEQTALARGTCANVMRISVGHVPFDTCVESLTQTLSNQTQNEILAKSYKDCLGSGYRESSSELATCMLESKTNRNAAWDSNPNGMASQKASVSYMENQSLQKSYSQSNPAERRQKEEYSCAQLGLPPGSAGFGDCVTHLGIALQAVEYSD